MKTLTQVDNASDRVGRGAADFIASLTETYLPTLTLSSSTSLSTFQFINSTLLEKAFTSLALAYFARAQNCPPARTEAARAYSAVLREARSTLASISVATGARIDGFGIDVLLLMIFFMSRYEDTVHSRSVSLRFRGGAGNPRGSGDGSPKGLRSGMLASFAHHDGAVAVLRVWVDTCRCRGGHMGRGAIPSEVVKLTRRAVMRSALMRGMMLPEWMHSGEVFEEGTGGVEERLDALAVRVVELRGRSVALGGAGADSGQTSCEERWFGAAAAAKRVYSEGKRVRSALEAWKGGVDWIQREMVAAKEKVYYFPTLAQAVLWCHYLTLAMLSESVCLRVLEFVKHEITGSGAAGWCDHLAARDLAAAHEVDLKTLARQLMASVPFVLGQVQITESAAWGVCNATWDKTLPPSPYRASLLVWPLTVASGIDRLEEQQRWFKAQLGYLGRVTGVGVLECAEGEEWLTF
ncbi:hypothetical protein BO82DRAFT_406727 [Aspergillus uvarum CBS 121591]|uniref:C6 transcription factor n=1 Tax=Aspergillus uvarum CBS 121591 TaxID=1448315 RepID=A0A319CN54_9EURO|nr:hypothetical protein BO82DRAFT_406727 [Aspergillus uvarum CBS 121591]PYH76898.1 hypothetical protein BO82DRAFT_406727 [Aspergillus uvarum CBS 121591]